MFNLSAPPVSLRSGATAGVTLSVPVTAGSSQAVTLSASSNVAGLTVSFIPPTVNAGEVSRRIVSTTSAVLQQSTVINVVGTAGSVQRSVAIPVEVVATNKFQNPGPERELRGHCRDLRRGSTTSVTHR